MRDSSVKRWSTIHGFLFRATNGRVGRRLVYNDMLLLTTTGRSTGTAHTVPLLYLTDGERLVVIASYGGRDRAPDWYLNLIEEPEVSVRTPGAIRRLRARPAGEDEHENWWPRVVDAYAGYAEYQAKTSRKIPIVFLEPA